MLKNKPIIFIILTYIISGIYSLLYFIFPYNMSSNKTISFLITSFYMFIPLLSTFILQQFIYRESFKNIGFNFKWTWWYLFSIFIPIILNFFAFFIAILLPDVTFSPDMSGMIERYQKLFTEEQLNLMKEQIAKVPGIVFFIGMILQTIFFGITINTVFAFGEEAGWRGFLLYNLKEKGFYFTSLITGLIWGLWHLPVVIQGHNYPEHKIAGVFMMILWTILLSPFFTFIVYKTGTVISAAIMHGVLNASYGLSIVYLKGGNDLTVGLTGLSGMIALLISNVLLFIYMKYYDNGQKITDSNFIKDDVKLDKSI